MKLRSYIKKLIKLNKIKVNPYLKGILNIYKNNIPLHKRQRIIFDFTVCRDWIVNNYITGIAREDIELLLSISKLYPTEIIYFSNNNLEPVAKLINKNNFSKTNRTFEFKNGDILLTIDIQIRGVHLDVNHPNIGFLSEKGVYKVAIINDLLPYTNPSYFENATIVGMPSYLTNALLNNDQIICISNSTLNDLKEFKKSYFIKPINFDLASKHINEVTDTYVPFKISSYKISFTQKTKLYFYYENFYDDITVVLDIKSRKKSTLNIKLNNNQTILINVDGNNEIYKICFRKGQLNKYGLQLLCIAQPSFISPRIYIKNILISSNSNKGVYIDKLLEGKKTRFNYVHLGYLENRVKSYGFISNSVKNFFGNSKVYLMVGTIEPRKGHETVLNAFTQMWENKFNGKLCIIGRIGWNVNNLISKLKNNAYINDKLLFLEGPQDNILDFCYKHSYCLIQASKGEGFGLPLIEASKYNLPIICSNLNVFKEIAYDNALYFDCNNINQLMKLINLSYNNHNILKTSSFIKSSTWDECANNIMNVIFENI